MDVLRPAEGIADGSGALRTGRGDEQVGSFEEDFFRYAAVLLNHLRGVAGEMALQHLKNAARIL